jgi:hypothetical protein
MFELIYLIIFLIDQFNLFQLVSIAFFCETSIVARIFFLPVMLGEKLFTAEELAKYDGTNSELPIYLAVKGTGF